MAENVIPISQRCAIFFKLCDNLRMYATTILFFEQVPDPELLRHFPCLRACIPQQPIARGKGTLSKPGTLFGSEYTRTNAVPVQLTESVTSPHQLPLFKLRVRQVIRQHIGVSVRGSYDQLTRLSSNFSFRSKSGCTTLVALHSSGVVIHIIEKW